MSNIRRQARGNTVFPDEVTGAVTLWLRFVDSETGTHTNIRRVLQGCFWNDDSIAVFRRTGNQVKHSATIFIPYGKETSGFQYVRPEMWHGLSSEALAESWTADPLNMPIMLGGENSFEFEPADPKAPNRIAVQETRFFEGNPNVRRAADINTNFFGAPDMWHVQIRC